MLHEMVLGFEDELARFRSTASRGFIMAFDITWRGPQYLHSDYDPDWRAIYEKKNFYVFDPVLIWAITRGDTRRWSEVPLPDARGVMKAASAFGLNFGMVTAVVSDRSRSFFTAARHDREFTDSEMALMTERFQRLEAQVMNAHDLDAGEIEVLRLMAQGRRNKEIAEELGVSESAIKQRSAKICRSLKAKTMSQAVAIAVARSLI